MQLMHQVHRWLGLLVGLQAVLWIVSGFGMSVLDAEVVSGEDLMAFDSDMQTLAPDARLIEANAILSAQPAGASVQALELRRESGLWVWRLKQRDGRSCTTRGTARRFRSTLYAHVASRRTATSAMDE